jgi:hypothetical protein
MAGKVVNSNSGLLNKFGASRQESALKTSLPRDYILRYRAIISRGSKAKFFAIAKTTRRESCGSDVVMKK